MTSEIISADDALAGRVEAMQLSPLNVVLDTSMFDPVPEGFSELLIGMGCFWGVERIFWQQPGVHCTMVGYAGGTTPNPTYEEVCTGQTGHAEVVRVIFDPAKTGYQTLLRLFWEKHDPTQGMRQGGDIGTQYRSVIYVTDAMQQQLATESKAQYQKELTQRGFGVITTSIEAMPTFYFAEEYHQQYLPKNPAGYCGIGGTGVSCPI